MNEAARDHATRQSPILEIENLSISFFTSVAKSRR